MIRGLLLALTCVALMPHTAWACAQLLTSQMTPEESLRVLVRFAERTQFADRAWTLAISHYLYPAIDRPRNLLSVGFHGGANSGKSTLFNYLGQLDERDTTGPVAGQTEQPVLLAAEMHARRDNFSALRWPIEAHLERKDGFFSNLIFVDSPPFDVRGLVDASERTAAAADVHLVVLHSTNYRSEPLLRVLQTQLATSGMRETILVLRTSGSVPGAVAKGQLLEVSRRLFAGTEDNLETDFPEPVIGAYVWRESEKTAQGVIAPQIRTLPGFPELPDLIVRLDAQSDGHREAAVNTTLQYVIDRAEQMIDSIDRTQEELVLTRRIFEIYLRESAHDLAANLPYDRIGRELETVWQSQSKGMRAFSRWVAHPWQMLRGRNRVWLSTGPGFTEMDRFLSKLIDEVIARLRVASLEGKIEVNNANGQYQEVVDAIEAYRSSYDLGEESKLSVQTLSDNRLCLYLPTHVASVRDALKNFNNQDWPAIAAAIKQETHENLANLTLQVQNDLASVAREQNWGRRTMSAFYQTMAIVPALAAVSYMAYSATGAFDMRTIAALLGAHLNARFFIYLDDENLRSGWQDAIQKWFRERQRPRLVTILENHLKVSVAAEDERDVERVRTALMTLKEWPERPRATSP